MGGASAFERDQLLEFAAAELLHFRDNVLIPTITTAQIAAAAKERCIERVQHVQTRQRGAK
jgi:hypothetical protein